ncbi:MAG: hypothetical protein HYS18_04065 [Burkholderiales bacterium]|nr:hypothetical protein [Burkholderiales bacterium]
MKKRLLCLAGLAVSVAAIPALAADGFVGMSFDKQEYKINETVAMTVQGMGTCKNIVVDWFDGTKTNVDTFVFGNVVGQNSLKVEHKYQKGGSFYPSVKTIPGPTLAEQCGSRSGSVKVVEPGKVTGITVTPTNAAPGQTISVKVDGTGLCDAPRRILYEYRTVQNQVGSNHDVMSFAADAPWPRVASFTADKTGWYVVYWLGTDSLSAPQGTCVSYFAPTFVEVKAAALPNIQVTPAMTKLPNNAPKPTITPKVPCKKPAKPGINEDKCDN